MCDCLRTKKNNPSHKLTIFNTPHPIGCHPHVHLLTAHVIGQALGVELYSSDEDEAPQKLPEKQIKSKSIIRMQVILDPARPNFIAN